MCLAVLRAMVSPQWRATTLSAISMPAEFLRASIWRSRLLLAIVVKPLHEALPSTWNIYTLTIMLAEFNSKPNKSFNWDSAIVRIVTVISVNNHVYLSLIHISEP